MDEYRRVPLRRPGRGDDTGLEIGQTGDRLRGQQRRVKLWQVIVPILVVVFICLCGCPTALFLTTGVQETVGRLQEGGPLFQPVATVPPGMEGYYPLPFEKFDNVQVGLILLVAAVIAVLVMMFAVKRLAKLRR